ncbi:unnamed protein product [Urochloa decumbens]|uniref:Uncharacterized protein n=1 Tax=Urochloa decumbens TaxID=240449 RepID=A0ABC9BEY7_9POAL
MAMRASAGSFGVRHAATSVAATGCRRLLSAFPSDDDKKDEDMENRIRARMELLFDRRVRAIVREESGDIIRSEVSKIDKERKVPFLLEVAQTKLALDFKPSLAENKLYLTKLVHGADTRMTKSSWVTSTAAKTFSSECGRKDNCAKLKAKLLDGKNKIFKAKLQSSRQIQAERSLLKGLAYVISVPSAIYGAATRFAGKGVGK